MDRVCAGTGSAKKNIKSAENRANCKTISPAKRSQRKWYLPFCFVRSGQMGSNGLKLENLGIIYKTSLMNIVLLKKLIFQKLVDSRLYGSCNQPL